MSEAPPTWAWCTDYHDAVTTCSANDVIGIAFGALMLVAVCCCIVGICAALRDRNGPTPK